MLKYLTLLLLILTARCQAQNIFTSLHLNDHREYRFGKPAHIIETNTFYSTAHTQVDKNIKTFDNAGMLLNEKRYNETGKLTASLTYENDTIRHITLQRIFERWTAYGYSKETALYSYNDSNFLTTITDVDADGKVKIFSKQVNNKEGYPIELHVFDGNGNSFGVEKAVYYYDKNIAITSVYKVDGSQLSTDTIKIDFDKRDTANLQNYNLHGDALAYTSKNPDGSIVQYEAEYTYDNVGNCIDEKVYKVAIKKNGKKKKELTRRYQKQITYAK